MKFNFNRKYTTIAAYVVIVFLICFLFITIVFRAETLTTKFESLGTVMSPIIWGFVITYLLSAPLNALERLMRKLRPFKKMSFGKLRVITVFLTLSVSVAVLSGIVAAIAPQLVHSYQTIYDSLPSYWDNLSDYVERIFGDNPKLYETLVKELEDGETMTMGLISRFEPQFSSVIDAVKTFGESAITFLIGVKDFFIGLLISIYLLYNKEKILAQLRKLLYCILPVKRCDKLCSAVNEIDDTLISFLAGKAIDSTIIGLLCFTGMTIMKMPYTLIISVIVGITNMVPFFGPFIGAVPSAFLILLVSPEKCLWFAIFILALQQFDGNFLGPKILGDKLGLPPFLVLFSIIIGGGLFQFIGMILFVPLFAVLYRFLKRNAERRLKNRGLPTETDEYIDGTRIFYIPPDENVTVADLSDVVYEYDDEDSQGEE